MNTGVQRTLSFFVLFGAIAGGMHLASQSTRNDMVIRADQASGIGSQMLQSAQQVLNDGLTAGMKTENYIVNGKTQPAAQVAQPLPQTLQMEAPPSPPSAPAGSAFTPSEVEVFSANGQLKYGSPRAVIHTSLGDIVIKLDIAHAPKTVKNFMELAHGDIEFVDVKTSRRVRRPFYDGLTIHKVVANSFIQMGCPFGTGRGGPGYTLPDEISKTLKFDRPGIVAMALARDGVKMAKDSNGSQFFITLAPQPTWDEQFTIFGEVESGLDIVRKISKAEVGPTDRPIRRIYMTSVEMKDDDSGPTHLPASVTPPGNVVPTTAPAVTP